MPQDIGSRGGTRATCMEFQACFDDKHAYNRLCAALDKEPRVRGVATYHTRTSERVRGFFLVTCEQWRVVTFCKRFGLPLWRCKSIYPGHQRQYWHREKLAEKWVTYKDKPPKKKQRKRKAKVSAAAKVPRLARLESTPRRASIKIPAQAPAPENTTTLLAAARAQVAQLEAQRIKELEAEVATLRRAAAAGSL